MSNTLNIQELYSGVYWVALRDQEEMALTFCRFQEYFESPKYKGKKFELNELLTWFKSTYGCSYIEEWTGFNIPDSVVDTFRVGLFDPLSDREKNLLCAIEHISKPYYLIASLHSDHETLDHEIAHAFFHLFPEYRKAILEILGTRPFHAIAQFLREKGYCEEVLLDEIHAYLMFDTHELTENKIQLTPYLQVQRDLLLCFQLFKTTVKKQSQKAISA